MTPTPAAHAAPAEDAHIGIQLLDAPVTAASDPRANRYIIDHVAPGTSVERRVRVTNSSNATERIEVYAAAAAVVDDHFTFASARAQNEMTSWITVDSTFTEVPPLSSADITVRIDVPPGATTGEQYGVIWAEVAPDAHSAAAGQVAHVYRAGVRIYLDVGPGGAPPTDFRIVSLTATRTDDGQPHVRAEVDNIGGRTLDLIGALQLSDGPAAQSAGPFPADSGVTLLPGHRGEVIVRLDSALPDGPWRADLSLTSGIVERNATATLNFPSPSATPVAVVLGATDGSDPPWLLIALAILVALAGAAIAFLLRRTRRDPHDRQGGPPPLTTRPRPTRRRPSATAAVVIVMALVLVSVAFGVTRAHAAEATVVLGRAESFSLLSGGTGVTNTGPTTVSADVGAPTASAVAGFPPGVIDGDTHVGDSAYSQALADLVLAYNNAASRTAPLPVLAGDLNGRTFTPGVYHADAAIAVTGTVTLDGLGDPNSVFIFQIGDAFNPAASSRIQLVNGASPQRVFWQVVGATTIGASASFAGTILTTAAITVGVNATLTGRALTTGGAIVLATNVISTPPIVTITGGATAYTLDTTPTISGTSDAAAGTTVTVSLAGQTLTTTIAATSGGWSVTAAALPHGSYTVVASVTGPAGNKGTARQTLVVGTTTPVALGRAASFAVLSGGTGVTNTGTTTLTADLGANSPAAIIGFPPGVVLWPATTHTGNAASSQGLADLALAYNDAAARTSLAPVLAGDLNGRTFTPGVYRADAAIALTGAVTLDGLGDPNSVFIFQIGAAFGPAASSRVELVNGASASRVFWQVVGATTIGASASFAGTILTTAAITVGANATLTGRALTTGGAIVLATNVITTPNASLGTLSINRPAASVDLGSFTNPVGGRVISGPLGSVQVDDTRSGSASGGWVASVSATDFQPSTGPAIPATAISYTVGPIAQIRGSVTYTVTEPSDLTNASIVVTASGASGSNAAATAWNPTLSVIVPSGAVAGIYTATVTYSVL